MTRERINRFLRHSLVAGYLAFCLGAVLAGIGLGIAVATFVLIRTWLGYDPILPVPERPALVTLVVAAFVILFGTLAVWIHLRCLARR